MKTNDLMYENIFERIGKDLFSLARYRLPNRFFIESRKNLISDKANQMDEKIVIFDIDGTLADISERIHHVKNKPKNWKAFFAGMAQDKTINSMVELCNILYSAGVKI